MLSETEQAKFTALWTEAQPSVSHYIFSVARDSAVVKDIVQSTALALLKKFPSYDDEQPFLRWALGVAKFEILGHQRDEARSRVRFDSDLLERYTETWAESAPELSEEASLLQRCLKKLTGRARDMVRLRYFEDLNSREIASRLDIGAGNVRVTLQRVRQQLRECVQRQQRSEGGAP